MYPFSTDGATTDALVLVFVLTAVRLIPLSMPIPALVSTLIRFGERGRTGAFLEPDFAFLFRALLLLFPDRSVEVEVDLAVEGAGLHIWDWTGTEAGT